VVVVGFGASWWEEVGATLEEEGLTRHFLDEDRFLSLLPATRA